MYVSATRQQSLNSVAHGTLTSGRNSHYNTADDLYPPGAAKEGPQDTDKKSANVCPPGYAPSRRMGGERANATQKVRQKPETQKGYSREFNGLQEDKNWHQCHHPGIREEQ